MSFEYILGFCATVDWLATADGPSLADARGGIAGAFSAGLLPGTGTGTRFSLLSTNAGFRGGTGKLLADDDSDRMDMDRRFCMFRLPRAAGGFWKDAVDQCDRDLGWNCSRSCN
jgi:hypothetical protein